MSDDFTLDGETEISELGNPKDDEGKDSSLKGFDDLEEGKEDAEKEVDEENYPE